MMKRHNRSTRYVGIWGTNWYYFVYKIYPYDVVTVAVHNYLHQPAILGHYQGLGIINSPFIHVNTKYDKAVHDQFLKYRHVRAFFESF